MTKQLKSSGVRQSKITKGGEGGGNFDPPRREKVREKDVQNRPS